MKVSHYASLPILGSLALAMMASTAAAQTINMTTWTATSPGFQEWWPKVEAAFEEKHPGVDLVIENIAFADYIRTLTTRFVAGSPPQVVHVPLPTINCRPSPMPASSRAPMTASPAPNTRPTGRSHSPRWYGRARPTVS